MPNPSIESRNYFQIFFINIKKPVSQSAGHPAGYAAGHPVGYHTLIHTIEMSGMREPPYGWLC